MAEELKDMDDAEDTKDDTDRYSLTVAVIKETLELHLHDKTTKYMYHGSFSSDDLQKCGFGHNQASDLQKVCKFMESARKGHSSLKFEILIEKNPNNQIMDGDIGIIQIVKDDEFFPITITLRLKQTPRKKIDILEEYINDLKQENDLLINKVKKLEEHVMPKGSIIMWSGNVDEIPKGWTVCNGENGAPDLRNRFIIGASDECKAQSTGGNKSHNHDVTIQGHQLTIEQMPSHSHSTDLPIWYQFRSDGCKWTRGQQGNVSGTYRGDDIKATGGNQPHDHNADSSETDHLPPYYALCFIIKQL